MTIEQLPLLVSVSIGVSLSPLHGTNFDVLSLHAGSAVQQAKALPERVAVFQADQDVQAGEQLALLSDLHRALSEPGNTEIVAFYQPQVDMSSGQLVGAEALLRWRHPTRGMVSPDQVVRVAEHSPLMRRISMSMVDQVLAQLAVWRSEGLTLNVSVNVSVRDLRSTEFPDWLAERLRQHRVDPSCLQLELTESAVMSQTEAVLDSLKALRQLGVGASLDDFGTGFSSLQHLRRLPLTEIKIEKSYVQSMLERREEESIVRAVIDLGRDLGLRVVAEGVEDNETRVRLLDAGCRVAQGYFYGKPMPVDEFAQWRSRRASQG